VLFGALVATRKWASIDHGGVSDLGSIDERCRVVAFAADTAERRPPSAWQTTIYARTGCFSVG
jgi:hypothetical protein